MAAGVRGRSPARSKSRTTPNNVGTGQNTPGSKSPRVAQQRGKGMDSDGSYRRKLRNTPDHLYGVDKEEDDLDSEDGVKIKCSSKKSWAVLVGLVLMLLVAIPAIIFLKDRDFRFDDPNLSADASICLRSHEELRKKLALAFDLINEGGKLFKQLERQTKHEFDNVAGKINNLDSKTIKEIGSVKREIEALKVTQIQRDNVDFSRYADKELPVDLSEVHSLVEMALLQYDADKIGIPDYALESAGGMIHVPYHSQTHSSGSPIMKVFGMVLWKETRTPREIIKPETLPGNCWPLKGSTGFVTIKLALPIVPSMVTMEHMHPSLGKFNKETWQSTPQNFTVFGWLDEYGKEKVLLGTYVYIQGGTARQTFPVQVTPDQSIVYVELQIDSNYGNPHYTCIYRFRVHGSPLVTDNSEKETSVA